MDQPESHEASVLVVDDNPLIVNVLKGLLAAENYQVFTSHNGEEALAVLKDRGVDVIVCDVMMPRMDGYELHQVVRERGELSHIPFVFLTALDNQEEINRGVAEGVDDYLVKPFEPDHLLSVIKGKVSRARCLKTCAEEKYDAYRKQVIHTLSHEFRTPLVAINTGTEILLEEETSLDQTKTAHLLEAIRRGGQRLERLVNDFMALQQIEGGIAERLFRDRAHRVKAEEFLAQIGRHLHEYVEAAGGSFTYHNDLYDAEVVVYEPQVHDSLERLVMNAVKFSEGAPEVELFVTRKKMNLCVEVRDRGIGIDAQRVKDALDLFGQVDRDKLEQQGGGFGLTIASHYARIHGGKLAFRARENGGSVVSFVLPILPPTIE